MKKTAYLAGRELAIIYVPVETLRPSEYNPRKWSKEAKNQLKESIRRFGLVDPILVNQAPGREGVIIGGHFRFEIAKELGIKEIPTVSLVIPDFEKEKELCIRLNKNVGEFDWDLLAEFSEEFLEDVGFSSEEIDEIFSVEESPEEFNLQKELKKLSIDKVEIKKGEVWQLGQHRLMCGDSTIQEDILKLMDSEKADMCFTDPPYLLDYLHGKKRKGDATEGFGYKRDRRYLETDSLPDNFTELWMGSIAQIQKENFHIVVYENWKNLRTVWGEMEKYWKVRNMLVWHLPNRVQGFAAKYKFFNKYDIAMVGSSDQESNLNLKVESELLQNEYETALYATDGKPHWEGYEKGKKICPTDFIEFVASDEKNSGQGVVFGTKPIEILIPYIKVLTKRDELIVDPFGGSGSTLVAAHKLGRRCYMMEKSPVYAEVIRRRWEKLTGGKAKRINESPQQ